MRRRVFISEFNSEEKLRSENAFTLPELSLFGKINKSLMDGMDELVMTMADEGDTVVTSQKLSQDYLQYWCENVCRIENIFPAVTTAADVSGLAADMSVYLRLSNDESLHGILKDSKIVNYALVPDYYDMCRELGIESTEPTLSVVKELNSKIYSNELKSRFDLDAKGIRISSVKEYDETVGKLLEEHGRILIKDAMGVSGKGMLLIDSVGMADRLSKHFHKQEEKGRTEFEFILEPYLNRVTDFSCIFTISESGEIRIDGFQKNESKGFAYHGTGPLSGAEYEMIMASGYKETVLKIAENMAARGYHGYACIDSMIAEGDRVIPLLEINPRMSVSRFNLCVSKKLRRPCRLGYFEGKRLDDVGVDKLLKELEELDMTGILFRKGRDSGVIPLAPGTWDSPEMAGKRVRIYYIIVYNNEEEYEKILAAWLTYCSGSICAGNIN